MDEQLLSISLQGPPTADESDYVLVEQEKWGKDVGRTSLLQGILAVGSMVFGGLLPLPDCGGFDGFTVSLYAYPSRKDLAFKFGVSHPHDYSPIGTIQTLTRTEILNCGLQSAVETKYPVQSMRSMVFLGPCYDKKGSIVPKPDVIQDGRTVRFSKGVLGSLRVTYDVYRIVYSVQVTKREYSLENNFEAIAYAVWNGGINSKDIVAPSGYEYTEGECENGKDPDQPDGSETEICPPPRGGSYPKAVEADRETDQDYCSQVIIRDVVTEKVITDKDGKECE